MQEFGEETIFGIRAAVVGAAVTALGVTVALASPLPGAASDSTGLMGERSPATPGSAKDVLDSNGRLQPVFASDPAHWGGAYVDGDFLVVKFVGRTLGQAQASLRSKMVVRGVRLVGVEVSLSDLEQAQKAVDQVLRHDSRAISWGPDYSSSSINVAVTSTDTKMLAELRRKVNAKVGLDVVPGARRPTTR